jgi:hypothetical protein
MVGPLYKFDVFGYTGSVVAALAIGFGFGFLLERVGFGSPRKLVAVFYLKDMAVLKVMFTSVAVAMLGLFYFSLFGWIDISKVYAIRTYFGAQLIGGLLIGLGLIVGGYCPTTSIVSGVTGRIDAWVFMLGMMAGVLVFAEGYSLFSDLHSAGSLGAIKLPQLLHISSGTTVFLVCLLAIVAFVAAEQFEKKYQTKPSDAKQRLAKRLRLRGAMALIVLGMLLMVANPDKIVAQRLARAQIGIPEAIQLVRVPSEARGASEGEPIPQVPTQGLLPKKSVQGD